MISGIVAMMLEMAMMTTIPVEIVPDQQIKVEIVTEEHISWTPYDSCPLDDDVQMLVHEIVEENYPMIDETVIMSLVFHESCGQFIYAKSGSGALGYCQLRPELFYIRATELNTSVYTEYGNVLVATDYLVELLDEYDDLAYCLDIYRGGEKMAKKWSNQNAMSPYSKAIIEMSDRMQKEKDGIK